MTEKAAVSKWDRFNEWIHCICVATFDLEQGQMVETVYPSHVQLSEQEKINLSYLAFPDSNSGCMGDTKFHICLRVAPAEDSMLKPAHLSYNRTVAATLKADSGHYWGFVYFRQVKDPSNKRGYFQKSLILLTRLPFINLFYELTSHVAPTFFNSGIPCLEAVCDNICHWPRLEAGETLNLHLLGTVYQTFIPGANNHTIPTFKPPGDIENNNPEEQNLDSLDSIREEDMLEVSSMHHIRARPPPPPSVFVSVHELDIFNSLFSVLSHLHLMWELMICAEPIVIIASSPTDCSHMVQSLLSLISPLAFCGESRPYFTIHDNELRELTQVPVQWPVILGVTNPFFGKTLKNWPHTVRLAESLNINFNSDQSHSAMGTFHSRKLQRVSRLSKLLGSGSGVCTQYKPFLNKDSALMKKIYNGVHAKRPSVVQSALLRRHFLELTHSFMIPLERYMASLMPLARDVSPFRAPPNPRQFKQDDFLATLVQSGPQLTATCKGDYEGLYKKFFRSANFKGWYEARYLELQHTLQTLQLQALSQADLNQWVRGKQEVEIVDMILRIKQKLQIPATCNSTLTEPSTSGQTVKKEVRDKLLLQIENMKKTLPEDLKLILQ